jgi:hypothetical protein
VRGSFLCFLLLEHFVDGLVEDSGVALGVYAFVIERAARLIKPAGGVRFFVNERDVCLQLGVRANKFPRAKSIHIRDRFEAFDPSENLPRFNRRAGLHLKTVVHHIAQHPRGEFREPNPPHAALAPPRPEMRRAVNAIHRQARRKMDALEEERFTWGSHGDDRKPQKIGLGKPAIVWLNKPMSQTEPFTMKVIGCQGQAKVDVVAIDGMQRVANVLRAGKGMTSRGVFRFKSFEEADEWLLEMKTRPEKIEGRGC